MAKEKAPHMPWYGREFYSDENVMVMALEQEATYLRLLWNCWQEGSIPADISKLAALSKNTPVGRFEKEIWPALRDLFMARGDNRLTHRKVESLRAAKDQRRTACSEAGKLGNEKRWGSDRTCDTGAINVRPERESGSDRTSISADYRLPITECREIKTNTCASDDARLSDPIPVLSINNPPFESSESHNELVLVSETESVDLRKERRRGREVQQEAWFEQWWGIYWRKVDRANALKSFCRRVLTPELFQRVMDATKAQSVEMLSREPQHRKHGSTWLNGECWNNEVAAPAVIVGASPSPYAPYRPPADSENTESYEDQLERARARARIKGNVGSSDTGGMYVRYKPPV